jgi:DNA-directed RNA polymerase sigma subunit (sigma70/sigma32)
MRETGDRPAIRSQEEIAKLFGITKARVSQIEQAALRKMARHPVLRQLAIDMGVLSETEEMSCS